MRFLSMIKRRLVCQIIKDAWWRVIVPEMRPIEHNRWLWATKN